MRILEVGPRVPKCWAPGGKEGTDSQPRHLLPSLRWSGTELCLPRGRDAFSHSHGGSYLPLAGCGVGIGPRHSL